MKQPKIKLKYVKNNLSQLSNAYLKVNFILQMIKLITKYLNIIIIDL